MGYMGSEHWIKPTTGMVYMYYSGVTNPTVILGGEGDWSYRVHDPYTIFINGINRTEYVNFKGLKHADNLTSKVDTFSFPIWDDYDDLSLQEGQSVNVYYHGTGEIIFSGEIIKYNQSQRSEGIDKYEYKVSYGFLKDRIITLLFSEKDINKMTEELKILFKKNLIPIRPERTNPRNKNRRTTTKLKVTKNQIDTI